MPIPGGSPPADVLVAYASKQGATAGIAAIIAKEFRARGLRVDVVPAGEVDDLAAYRLVVLGSAIYLRRWRPDAVRFLSRHATQLRGLDLRLFQSGPCGPDAEHPDEPEPARVRRLREAVDAGAPVTFGGQLDPTTARGPLARWLARGELAGDFRDTDRIRRWTGEIASYLTSTSRGKGREPIALPD